MFPPPFHLFGWYAPDSGFIVNFRPFGMAQLSRSDIQQRGQLQGQPHDRTAFVAVHRAQQFRGHGAGIGASHIVIKMLCGNAYRDSK